jgi:hypothetical protein
MKYLKKFNEKSDMSIEKWCRGFGLRGYSIRDDSGIVDVKWSVDISNENLRKIPIQFGIVTASFNCCSNRLTSLKGSPIEVSEDFQCEDNQLKSLEGGPEIVGSDYYCYDNRLISLEGYPEKLGGDFYMIGNPIYQVYRLFGNYEGYKSSLDFNYFRNDYKCINRRRFELACKDAKIPVPDSIPDYEYID